MTGADGRSVGIAATALLASSATLVCCVLPAVLVAVGAGAALTALVAAVPQLVWLSEHKSWVFGIAGGFLIVSGAAVWNARRLPCPTDPAAARQCTRLRSIGGRLYIAAVFAFVLGALFAYGLPLIRWS